MSVNKLSRRYFLQSAAVLTAGLAAVACTPKVVKETVIVAGAPQVVEKEVVVTAVPAALALECKGHVTLGYYTSTTPAIDRMKRQEKGFNEKHPDVDVEIIQFSRGVAVKYGVMLAAGTEPNVVWMGTGLCRFTGGGAFLDLDPLFEADIDIRKDEYYPQVLELFTWQGKLYGLPYGFTSTVYAYNEDLLASEGVPFPSETWTLDDYISIGQALTKDLDGDGRTDQYGVRNPGFYQCLWEHGGDVFTPEVDRATMDTPEAVAALQFMYDLTFGKYKVAPTPDVERDIGAFPLFNTGKIGISQIGRWGVPVLRKGATDFTWNVAVAPNQKGSWISGEAYSISASTEDKGAAWCLLKYLCDREAQETFYMPEGSATPSIKAVAESDAYMNDGKLPENDKAFVDTLDFAKHTPLHPIEGALGGIFRPITDQLYAGDITAEGAAAKMQEEFTVKLDEYKGIWKE